MNRNLLNKTLKISELQEPDILDGSAANSLAESVKEYKTKSGDSVCGATDKGMNYHKPKNEDRVGVSPEDNLVVVADGVGGSLQGAEAAQIVVEAYQDYPDDPYTATLVASQIMTHEKIKGSACYAAIKITEKRGRKHLNVSQAGDVKVIVIRKGKIFFESEDHNRAQESVSAGTLTKDQALYDPSRREVTNLINKDYHYPHIYDSYELEKGDIVIAMTDGISDNFTSEEIAMLIMGRKPEEIIKILSDESDKRMLNAEDIACVSGSAEINDEELKEYTPEEQKEYKELKERYLKLKAQRIEKGEYSDGYVSEPKPDNRGMAVIQIN